MKDERRKRLLLIPFAAAALIVGLFLRSSAQTPSQQQTQQEATMLKAWGQCHDSVIKEGTLVAELTKSLRLNPPWRVLDAREPEKRAKLIDKIIVEYQLRIKLLEKIKHEDGQ